MAEPGTKFIWPGFAMQDPVFFPLAKTGVGYCSFTRHLVTLMAKDENNPPQNWQQGEDEPHGS